MTAPSKPTPREKTADACFGEPKGCVTAEFARSLELTNAALVEALEKLEQAAAIVCLNAQTIPDPHMGGLTDISAVPIEDIEELHGLLAEARAALSAAKGEA